MTRRKTIALADAVALERCHARSSRHHNFASTASEIALDQLVGTPA